MSRTDGGSKGAQFFSSAIDLVQAVCIRSWQIGYYWWIARAGFYKGCIWASFDFPPARRYGAQSRGAEIISLILGTHDVSCGKKRTLVCGTCLQAVIRIRINVSSNSKKNHKSKKIDIPFNPRYVGTCTIWYGISRANIQKTGFAVSPLINLGTQHDGRSARTWMKRV